MTNDEITRMAKQIWMAGEAYIGPSIDSLARFAALVAAAAEAAERQAIIDIVAMHGGSVEIEATIRARGQA